MVSWVNFKHIARIEWPRVARIYSERKLSRTSPLYRETGMEKDADYTILLYNSHKGKGNTSDLLENYYRTVSPQLMRKILAIYRKDFTMFGYDPSDFLKKMYPDGSVVWNPEV